jgi:hypothetical protein
MNERSIFIASLDKRVGTERTAFLDEACTGDSALRQRVEALLLSHEGGGDFLEKPAPQRVAEALQAQDSAEQTSAQAAVGDRDGETLDFLLPSEKPGHLGRLGHYEVLEVIGKGGMGIVLKAFDEKLQRVVAIKTMLPQLASSANARQRFKREAQAAAAIRNEHVIDIHAVEEQNRLPYLVMEYISGLSLQQRLDHSRLELKEILRIGMQTARGLAAAHAQGLVHRDIKPANILLENGVERVKITDFGLARTVDDASLTQSGVITGTPHYMSPEQARGEHVDHRADLFGLGSLLYVMCTGRPPFRAENTMAVLKRVCEGTPHSIRELNPEVPDWLAAMITRLHAKDPAERFQSAAEVAQYLENGLAHLHQPSAVPVPAVLAARTAGAAHSLRHRRVLAAVAVLFAAGALVVGTLVALPHLVDWSRGTDGQGANGPASPGDPAEPFVVLARGGRADTSHGSLAEAVAAATSKDTIEIRGNGPFVCPSIVLAEKALTIRAAAGTWPVLKLAADASSYLLNTKAALVLEGLEIQRDDRTRDKVEHVEYAILSQKAPLCAANCRFTIWTKEGGAAILLLGSPNCEARNCQFAGTSRSSFIGWVCPKAGRILLENNVIAGGSDQGDQRGLAFHYRERSAAGVSLRLTRNTMTVVPLWFLLDFAPLPVAAQGAPAGPLFDVETTANVVDTPAGMLHFEQAQANYDPQAKPLPAPEAEALLRHLLSWREQANVYPAGDPVFVRAFALEARPTLQREHLADWPQFWSLKETNSLQGPIRYEGGDVRARVAAAPKKVTPADFRLHQQSAGYRAGKDQRDLGADVIIVGPGPAYERWKKTPEYQEWLRDTGQKK